MKLTLDPVTGLAGDMFVAALIDAGAGQELVLPVMQWAARLLGQAEVTIEKVSTPAGTGTRLRTGYPHDRPGIAADNIREMFEKVYRAYAFTQDERRFADKAFTALCQAELSAHEKLEPTSDEPGRHHHGVSTMKHVHLHEAQDILVDMCGAARSLTVLDVDITDIVCLSPVFCGGGNITFSHGVFPVPAPATRTIIKEAGIPVREGPVARELLTPTGAAVLAALGPRYIGRRERPAPIQAATGLGLGTLEFEPKAGPVNGLRIFLRPS